MASGSLTSWQIDGKKRKQWKTLFWGLQNHCGWGLQPWNWKTLVPWKESYDKPTASKRAQSRLTLYDSMDCSPPLSMGLSRQEYWSRLPCSPPGDLSNPGIKPVSSALAGGFFTAELLGKPQLSLLISNELHWVLQSLLALSLNEWACSWASCLNSCCPKKLQRDQ